MFLKNNYNLLASAMEIDVQKAQVIQAKLYPNPILTADINAYDPEHKKPLHVDGTGQKSFQFEQLIVLGGKRMAQIEMAKTNVQIAELEFQDLLRHLKYQLHTSMYNLSQQVLLLHKYNTQLGLLDTILTAYDVQVKKGNIPLKDVVRLKGVYMNLNNNRAEVFKLYYDELARVQTIIQTSKVVMPLITDEDIATMVKSLNLEDLNALALQNRPDYLIVEQNKSLAIQYLDYQKRMATPDMNLITSYDQRGGAFRNQFNFGISMPLPLWNRNQGNIRSAEYSIRQMEYQVENMKMILLTEVQGYFLQYKQTVLEYKKTIKLYNNDFEITLKGMSDNFQKGNVSLIEFVDFFEGYNNSLSEIARIKIQLATSAEQLNLSTGKEIF